jgi:hypothetical protein
LAADFAYGSANAAFAIGEPGRLEAVLRPAVEQGRVAVELPTYPNRPDSAIAAWLLAWPSDEIGLMSFVRAGENRSSNEWKIAWPFYSGGVEHDLEITEIHHDVDVPEIRLYEGRIGSIKITAFDTFCAGCSRLIGVDDFLQTRLCGWASWLRRGATEPYRFMPEDVSSSLREAFRETFETEGALEIHTDKLVSLIPALSAPSPLYEIRSPVKVVREITSLPNMRAWMLTLAIGQPDPVEQPGAQDIDIDLCVTEYAWRNAEPPQIGDPVEGVIWLQLMFR